MQLLQTHSMVIMSAVLKQFLKNKNLYKILTVVLDFFCIQSLYKLDIVTKSTLQTLLLKLIKVLKFIVNVKNIHIQKNFHKI